MFAVICLFDLSIRSLGTLIHHFNCYDVFCELWALFAKGKRSLLTELLAIVIFLSFGVLQNNTPRQLWFISVSSWIYLCKFRIRLRQWRRYGKYITEIAFRNLFACNRNTTKSWLLAWFYFSFQDKLTFVAVKYETMYISILHTEQVWSKYNDINKAAHILTKTQ